MNTVELDITIEDLKKGSEIIYKTIYENNRTKFLNFARRYGLEDDDIVDVYQDAYIAFYNNVMSGKLETLTSSVSTYIISIGKFMIFDKLKRNKTVRTVDFDVSVLQKNANIVDAMDIETEALTVQQRLLKKHFKTLGRQCQELLTLFYYRGFTIKEILNHGSYNSENVVKSAKSRCMKTLKERIKLN
ncbi:RNA polymerase sigma factor [Bizionia paragorgiae]|uniref:RNA polymerase sigma factor, sigma-70 family n=1 Tax=Bizionia paragorgiae TaxID=283786 RepID=A0A1H3WQ54_BIZPA|nr:sigma-70 family RNA polymerase sigma factor [Bizionia paragorgiae]MDX1271186.1 sigma-70 family RNA polymerase sigma factor [Bizionia paragorgiae]SDZ88522.1 RNA polymerase sigma factor, sigma-70 family [Bizionia paragorgiae]